MLDRDRTKPEARALGSPVRDGQVPDLDLTLHVGETREIDLPSQGTAGFVWTHELEDGEGIVRLTQGRARPAESEPVGRSTIERVLIRATAPGRALIRLQHARPWESGKAPHGSLAIKVQVVPAG